MHRTDKELGDEWDNLPFGTQMRIPITAAVPMWFRWKIMQMKLLMNDLEYLEAHHKIQNAAVLRHIVNVECEELCETLAKEIVKIQEKRRE